MRRSRLESYEAILEALMKRPMSTDRMAYETGMDCTVLGSRLDFLEKQGLVQERAAPKKLLYAITERGVAVLKTLNFHKYLEKISGALSTIDDAMQTLPLISRDYEGSNKEQGNENY